MVFRLAELREAVGAATDPAARKAAQKEQDALILALWAQRSALPVGVAADRRVGASLALMDALLAERERWHRPHDNPQAPHEIIEAMNDAIAGVIRLGMVLLYERQTIEAGPEDPNLLLSNDERAIRERIDDLRSIELRRLLTGIGQYSLDGVTHEEAAALLEQRVDAEIHGVARLLEALRITLLPNATLPPKENAKSRQKATPERPASTPNGMPKLKPKHATRSSKPKAKSTSD